MFAAGAVHREPEVTLFNLHPILRKAAPPAAKAEPDAVSFPKPVFRTTRIKKAPHRADELKIKDASSLNAAAEKEAIKGAHMVARAKLEDVVSAMRASQRMNG